MRKKIRFVEECPVGYTSPRWSGELLDCSLPMVLDTYSKCSYDCVYCFGYYQKSLRKGGIAKRYNRKILDSGGDFCVSKGVAVLSKGVKCFNVEKIKKLFDGDTEELGYGYQQFDWFIKSRYVIQWGGLTDPFDEYERKYGVTLSLLKYFREIKYPISFCTKGCWWIDYGIYRELILGADHFNFKVSIISMQDVPKVERGVPTVKERLRLIYQLAKLGVGGVTLRLRPFIIGISDRNNEYLDLIREAYNCGATAVSTEFWCLETRVKPSRFRPISDVCGFDVRKYYAKNSFGAGYQRLNYDLKQPFMEKMLELCRDLGLRFYVSDAHHKEKSYNSCCCGLPLVVDSGQSDSLTNYFRGHFTEALLIAKQKGEVCFDDISQVYNWKNIVWYKASGFNTGSGGGVFRYRMGRKATMLDYVKGIWNNPSSPKSPSSYFGGVLVVKGVDTKGNIIYKYNKNK
jgi:DNA repair photolyase